MKNEYIIYKRDVCKISNIIPNYYKDTDYYLLNPITDDSLTIKIPVNNKEIRPLLTRAEVDNIIKNIPSIMPLNDSSNKLENTYKELLATNKHEDLVKIIKTTYLRNKERLDNNKKTTDKDTYYFNLAEKYLYTEFSVVLNLSYEETKEYIINTLTNLS